MITILINDKKNEISDNITISELLQENKTTIKGIAIAINNEVIPKNKWSSHQIINNDNVLIIKATQGG